MQVKLVKKQVIYKNKLGEEKKIYNLKLILENGNEIAIAPLVWKDKNGNNNSTYRDLILIAEELD